MSKARILLFNAGVLAALAAPLLALAGPDIGVDKGGGGLAGDVAGGAGYTTAGVSEYTLSETVGRIIRVALSLIGTIFFALTVYAGFLWMTAGGNEEKITQAVGLFKAAFIGLVIVLAAYSITIFVFARVIRSTAAPGGQVGGQPSGFFRSFTGF